MFKKSKLDLNFVESQKLGTKQNQSTSFEFIMTVAVILIIAVMGFLYYDAWDSNDKAVENTKTLKDDTDRTLKDTSTARLNELLTRYDELTAQLNEQNAAKDSALLEIEVTSVHLLILYTEAHVCDVEIQSVSLSNTTLTVNCTASVSSKANDYLDALQSTTVRSTGLINSEWYEYVPTSFTESITDDVKSYSISLMLKTQEILDDAAANVQKVYDEAAKIGDSIAAIATADDAVITESGIRQRLVSEYDYKFGTSGVNDGRILGSFSTYTLIFTPATTSSASIVEVISSTTGAMGKDRIKVTISGAKTAAELQATVSTEANEIAAVIRTAVGDGVTSEAGLKQILASKFYDLEGDVISGLYGNYTLTYTVATETAAGSVKVESNVAGAQGDSAVTVPTEDVLTAATKAAAVLEGAHEIETAIAAIAKSVRTQEGIIDALKTKYFYDIAATATANVSLLVGSYSDYTLTFAEAKPVTTETDDGSSTYKIESVEVGANGENALTVIIRNRLTVEERKQFVIDEADEIATVIVTLAAAGYDTEAEILQELAVVGYTFSTEVGREGQLIGEYGYAHYTLTYTAATADSGATVRIASDVNGARGDDALSVTVTAPLIA